MGNESVKSKQKHVFKGMPYPCLPDVLTWHCIDFWRSFSFLNILRESSISLSYSNFFLRRAQTKEIIPFKYRLVSQWVYWLCLRSVNEGLFPEAWKKAAASLKSAPSPGWHLWKPYPLGRPGLCRQSLLSPGLIAAYMTSGGGSINLVDFRNFLGIECPLLP